MEGDFQPNAHPTAPWVTISDQTKKDWGNPISKGHGIRVVQPKVD